MESSTNASVNTSTIAPSASTVASPKHSSNLLLTVLIVLGVALVTGAAVYLWQVTNFTKQIDALEKKIDELEEELESAEENLDPDSEDTEEEDSTITSYDAEYDLYTNNEYGFSMLVPVEFYHSYGADCVWDSDSYRPAGAIVPTAVFEGDGVIYITSEYFYNLTDETEVDGYHTYAGCELITNSLATLESSDYYFQQNSWKIVVAEVNNETELTEFIQDRYGGGCSIGTQTPASQEGVFDVSVTGPFDIENMDDPTTCPVNYATVLKYYPAGNIVVAWDLGQAITFVGDENWTIVYDNNMVDSFEFIE